MLQEVKQVFKELYVSNELLFFEDYVKTLDGMSEALFDVVQIVECCKVEAGTSEGCKE